MATKHIVKYPNGATFIYYQSNVNSETKICVGMVGGSSKDWKHGTAHAVEHCSFLGIPGMTREEIDRKLRLNAVRHNAFTTQDDIHFVFNVPNSNLNEVSKIYSEIFAKKDFDDESWSAEREIIIQEKYMLADQVKDATVGVLDYLYDKSTYGTDRLIGSEESLYKITAKDLTRFKENYFISENLIVSAVSNLPYKVIKQIVERDYIYKFPSKPKNKVIPKKRTYNFRNQLIAINDPRAKSFTITFILKGLRSYEKNELFTQFEDWYFNGLSGRLDRDLRHEYPLTYSPSLYNYEPKNMRFKVFEITTTPENANACVYLMCNILNDVITKGISEEEFAEFQQTVAANRERRTILKNRTSYELYNACLDQYNPFVKNFYRKLTNLTRDDINNYLHKTYMNSKLTLGYNGNIEFANNASLLMEPYSALSVERINELYDPLLGFEEVIAMYNPKAQGQKIIEDIRNEFDGVRYAYPREVKPPKLSKKAVRDMVKRYLKQKAEEETETEEQKPVEEKKTVEEQKTVEKTEEKSA